MRGLVWRGPGQIAIEDVAPPAQVDGEVVVRVTAAGVCGSDLDGMRGEMANRRPPLVMGHEFEGVVESAADPALSGRRVVVNPIVTCGACELCRRGPRSRCEDRVIVGIGRPGAYADLVAVPAASVVPLPDGFEALAGALVEPLATCLHAFRLGIAGAPARTVLVLGAGSLGQLLVQLAVGNGSHTVVTDVMPDRLATAADVGAVAIRADDPAGIAAVAPAGGFDLVLDAVGSDGTRRQALEVIGAGGRIVLVGLRHDAWTLSAHKVVRREITIVGSFIYTDEDFAAAIEALRLGRVAWRPFTLVRPLEDAPASIHDLLENPGAASKVLFVPSPP